MIDWLVGAIDLHLHAAPSLFARWGTGDRVADVCRDAGMAAIVLKAHEGSTVEVAGALSATHAPLRVIGGVVLNRYVGGVNPDAVLACALLGGRVVWMPTIDSEDHLRAYGATGSYRSQHGGISDDRVVRLLDARGRLVPEVMAVLEIARDNDMCVCTGHAGAAAIEALIDAAGHVGLDRVLLQHPLLSTPGLGLDQIRAIASRGVMVELTYLSVSPMWAETTLQRCVEVLSCLDAGSIVISSDSGQAHSPAPPEALRCFAQSLHELGIEREALRRALTDNPARLLGL